LKDPEFTLKFHRGDLFADTKDKAAARAVVSRREPVVLDANVDAVVRTLEAAEKQPNWQP
jgi:hypothetical protein